MRPSEVRDRVLSDHAALRARLEHLEQLADHAATRRGADPEGLRAGAEALLATLREHMRWEDRFLLPLLRDADGWGDERARRFEAEHAEQREVLGLLSGDLREGSRPPRVVAAHLLDLIEGLRLDMDEEERVFLDPCVVRDDVVGIDVETG